MPTFWNLRVENQPEWKHLPSTRLKIKPFDICNTLYRAPPYKCIAWSEDNLIAFSPIEPVMYSQNIDNMGHVQQPIYIVLPEAPESHIMIISPHLSPIRTLEWAPLSCGQYLLSVDIRDRACVWKMREHVNDWVCVYECNIECTVAAKWISFDAKIPDPHPVKHPSNRRRPTTPSSPMSPPALTKEPKEPKIFPLSPATPCFVAISAFTNVVLCYYNAFEGWSSLSCNLAPTLGYIPGGLARADITTTSHGTILIAVSGLCIGNTIGVYELTFDLLTSSFTGKLKSRVELSVPLPVMPPSTLLSTVEPVLTLIHMEFDPASDGKAIITLSAMLNPQPPIVRGDAVDGAPPMDKLEEVGNVQLERYEYKRVPVFQDRSFLLPLVTLPAVKDSQPLMDNLWIPVGSIPLDPLERIPYNHVGGFPPPEWVAGLNPLFATVCRCVNGGVWIGFLGGRVEAFDIKTLKPYTVLDEMKSSKEAPHSSTMTMFGQIPPIPVSLSLSPNGECIAILHYDVSVQVCIVPDGMRPNVRDDVTISNERRIACLLETSMVKGSDAWDILASVSRYAPNEHLHLGICDCHLVCILVAQDLYTLAEPLRRHFMLRWEPLRASLYAICLHTSSSVHLACAARAYVNYLSDTLRSFLVLPIPHNPTSLIPFDELLANASSAPTAQNAMSTVFFPPGVITAFAPLEEWVVNFVDVLLKCFALFVYEMRKASSQGLALHVRHPGEISSATDASLSHPPIHPNAHENLPPKQVKPRKNGTTSEALASLGTINHGPEPAPVLLPESELALVGMSELAGLDAGSHVEPLPDAEIFPNPNAPMETDEGTGPPEVQIISPVEAAPAASTPSPALTSPSGPISSSPSSSPNRPTLTSSSPSVSASPSLTSPSPMTITSPSIVSNPLAAQAHPPGRPHSQPNRPLQQGSGDGKLSLDYHFEFLQVVSNLDTPLASFLFDVNSMQVLQNLIALVALSASVNVPGKPSDRTAHVKELKAKHQIIGTLVNKLHSLTEKDPSFWQIDYIEECAVQYAESIAEVISLPPIEELRAEIPRALRALDIDVPFTPVVKRPRTHQREDINHTSRDGDEVIDVLTFTPMSLSEGPYRECILCGRVTRATSHKPGDAHGKTAAATWVDRWTKACPICNGKWLWVNNQ